MEIIEYYIELRFAAIYYPSNLDLKKPKEHL